MSTNNSRKKEKLVIWEVYFAILVNRAKNYIDYVEENINIKKGENCAVCLDGFESKDTKTIKCGHCFHKNCIETWLYQQYTCPLCRAKMPRDLTFRVQRYPGQKPKPRERRLSI